MRLVAIGIMLCIMTLPLHAEGNANSKENSLPGLSVEEKIPVLAELVKDNQKRIPHNAIAYGREALVLLNLYPNDEIKFDIFNGISTAYMRLGKYPDALAYAERSKQLAEQLQRRPLLSKAFSFISVIQRKNGKLDHALAAGLQARRLDKDSSNCENDLNLGIVYRRLGSYKEALSYFFKALNCEEQQSDLLAQADVYGEIGLIYRELEEYSKGLAHLESALNIAKKVGEKTRQARLFNDIGNLLEEMGDPTEALNHHFKALKIHKQLEDETGIAESNSHIGRNYLRKSKYGLSLDYLNSADKQAIKLDNNTLSMSIRLNKSEVYSHLGQYNDAAGGAYKVLKQAEMMNNIEIQIAALERLTKIYEVKRDYATALDYQRRTMQARNHAAQEEFTSRVAFFNSVFEQEKQVALLQKEADLRQAAVQKQRIWGFALLILLVTAFIIGMLWVSRNRIQQKAHHDLKRAFGELEAANQELKVVNRHMIRQSTELHDAISRIKHLNGFLPMCSLCKSVRTEPGYWQELERYIDENSNAELSKSICPACESKRLHALPPLKS